MGRSIGSVVRGPVGVGVMRGRRVVRRRRGVGGGLVVTVGRRSGSGVGGGRLEKMNSITLKRAPSGLTHYDNGSGRREPDKNRSPSSQVGSWDRENIA